MSEKIYHIKPVLREGGLKGNQEAQDIVDGLISSTQKNQSTCRSIKGKLSRKVRSRARRQSPGKPESSEQTP